MQEPLYTQRPQTHSDTSLKRKLFINYSKKKKSLHFSCQPYHQTISLFTYLFIFKYKEYASLDVMKVFIKSNILITKPPSLIISMQNSRYSSSKISCSKKNKLTNRATFVNIYKRVKYKVNWKLVFQSE